MSNATFRSSGVVIKLDRPAQPDVQLTEEDCKKPKKLSVVLTKLLRDVATLTRKFSPPRRDFEDIVFTGTVMAPQNVRLNHKLGGRVRWWIVDSSAANPNVHTNTTATTKDVLVLTTLSAGIYTIRVEAAG